MNESNLSPSLVARQELENSWHRQVEGAEGRYKLATKRYRQALKESNGLPPEENLALLFARHEQSEALMEFHRVLRIFTELTVHGRIPEEIRTATTGGGSRDGDSSDFGR